MYMLGIHSTIIHTLNIDHSITGLKLPQVQVKYIYLDFARTKLKSFIEEFELSLKQTSKDSNTKGCISPQKVLKNPCSYDKVL